MIIGTTLYMLGETNTISSNLKQISVKEVGESIEIIFKQLPTFNAEERVFKIIYSCVNGKWNKSAPIYGTIIPATEESYETTIEYSHCYVQCQHEYEYVNTTPFIGHKCKKCEHCI